MQPNFEAGDWAIVTVGSEKYIGCLHVAVHTAQTRCASALVFLDQALKLTVMDIPIRGPQGETGFQHLVQCAPLDNGLHPATLYVAPTSIRYFEDMHEDDKGNWHAEDITMEQR